MFTAFSWFFLFFDVCRFPAVTPARRGKCCSLSSIRSTSADADHRDITYHALFQISVHQYYTFFPNFTSGSFRFSKWHKNRPDLLLRKPGRFTCIICAFSSAHAKPCGDSWSQPERVPKLQSVRSNGDTLFVNFQCVLLHLRNDLLQIFFLQIEFRQFCLVI